MEVPVSIVRSELNPSGNSTLVHLMRNCKYFDYALAYLRGAWYESGNEINQILQGTKSMARQSRTEERGRLD
jgi:hypothetical protein